MNKINMPRDLHDNETLQAERGRFKQELAAAQRKLDLLNSALCGLVEVLAVLDEYEEVSRMVERTARK